MVLLVRFTTALLLFKKKFLLTTMQLTQFNIRVYGILVTTNNEVLLSDERINGTDITKFPGGGLELGEGTRECLIREYKEELNLDITVGNHLYTTDYFVQSAFKPTHQIVSIYYFVSALQVAIAQLTINHKPFAFKKEQLLQYQHTKQIETHRLIPLQSLTPSMLSMPIDKVVADLIRK